MTGDAVNGRNGCDARAGARTLNLLAAPLNAQIVRALQDGAKKQVDLRRETGHPAQTTLRAQLKKLCNVGVVEKRRRNSFPGVLEYELNAADDDLISVMRTLELWLDRAPQGRLELGNSSAKAAVKALTEGWSTAMLRALAARPITLTELDSILSTINYPSLERRLAAMHLAGLVDANEADGRGTPYGVTEWARRGAGPLVAAIRWEHSHGNAETTSASKLDVETAFLLAADLFAPPADATGCCRLAVELRDGKRAAFAGLRLGVRAGRVTSLTTKLEGDPDAWVSGPLVAWLAALVENEHDGLEIGGDTALARKIVEGLHAALFGALPVSD